MTYLGNFPTGVTFDHKFTTVTTTGAPTQLAGTPAISIYKDNDTTQTTTGVTLTVDFDSVTGLNNVRVVTTDSFYAAGSNYQIVITTGTVGGTSVVGYVVGSFSLRNRIDSLGIVDQGTAQSATSSTIVLRAAAAFANDEITGATVVLTGGTGVGQARVITDYVSSTDTATVSPAWGTTPSGTITYMIVATAPAPTAVDGLPAVNVTHYGGVAGTFASGIPEVKVNNIAAGAITAAAVATGAIDADALAADAVDEILDEVVEGSTTLRQMLRGFAAALLAKASGLDTTTAVYRDIGDTKNRITATVTADGNRTAVTLDLT